MIPLEHFRHPTLNTSLQALSFNMPYRTSFFSKEGEMLGDTSYDLYKDKKSKEFLKKKELLLASLYGKALYTRKSSLLKKEYMYFAMKYHRDTKHIGYIRIGLPDGKLAIFDSKMNSIFILSLGIVFIFGLILTPAITKRMTRPIIHLTKIATAIANDDYSGRSNLKGRGTIARLGKALDIMADKIRTNISDLQHQSKRLYAILSSMQEAVLVIEKEGNISLANRSVNHIFGIDGDVIGTNYKQLVFQKDFQIIFEESLKNGASYIEEFSPAYKERIFFVTFSAIGRDAAVVVFHDITQLKNFEKIRQDFAANVSHELKTPLAVIRGYAETLLNTPQLEKETLSTFLNVILRNTRHLTNLIDNILELSKLESGTGTLFKESVNLYDMCNSILKNLQEIIKRKEIHTINLIPQELPPLRIDRLRFESVLTNLVENAIKYNKPQGLIEIQASKSEECYNISIKDTGVGISEKDQNRIFERFYRVDKARSREMGGTGLGLAIVKHIVAAHGGNINLESLPGEGSRFSIEIPTN
jgi:two-component system phosphate regulon sensor histidine kinase PhoR